MMLNSIASALDACLRSASGTRSGAQSARAWGAGFVGFVGLVMSTTAFAQETARPFAAPSTMSSSAPSGVASLGQVTLALGMVLALIFGAAWVLRRMRGFGKNASGALDIIADLPLGQKERAVLIRVGAQQVLIGVAPGRVTTLHVLAEPVNVSSPGSDGGSPVAGNPVAGGSPGERPNFKALLMKSLGK